MYYLITHQIESGNILSHLAFLADNSSWKYGVGDWHYRMPRGNDDFRQRDVMYAWFKDNYSIDVFPRTDMEDVDIKEGYSWYHKVGYEEHVKDFLVGNRGILLEQERKVLFNHLQDRVDCMEKYRYDPKLTEAGIVQLEIKSLCENTKVRSSALVDIISDYIEEHVGVTCTHGYHKYGCGYGFSAMFEDGTGIYVEGDTTDAEDVRVNVIMPVGIIRS